MQKDNNLCLQRRDSPLHIAFDNITEPVFILDRTGTIIDANNAFSSMFGKNVQEILNTNAYDLLPSDLVASRREKVEESFSTGEALIFEDEQNGRCIRQRFNPVKDNDGRIVQLFIFVEDITELKLAEKEKEMLQIFNNALVESIPGAFYMLDTEGRYVQWNAYQRDIVIGNQESEMSNTFALESIHPDDRLLAEEKIANVMKTGIEESEEMRVLLHGGPEYRWYQLSAKRITINEIHFLIGTAIDITDRKRAEETALKTSEGRFRKLFEEHSSIMVVIEPLTHKIIDANEAAANFYGWPVEKLKTMSADQLSAATIEEVNNDITNISGLKLKRFSRIHKKADGSIRDVEITINMIVVEGTEFIYAIVNDITERKLAEQALLSSERKFRSITEQMAEMVYVTDSGGSLTYVSPAAEKLLGYCPHEMIGHIFTEYMAEEEIPEALALFHDTLLHNLSTRILEFKFIKKNGSFFDVEVHYQFYHDNESSGMIGVVHDITERKNLEIIRKQYDKQLLESQQFLASIYEEVNHSIFVVDVQQNGEFRFKGINPIHEKLTGIKNEMITGKTPDEFLDPEVAGTVIHNYETCIREGRAIQYEESLLYQGKMTWWETVLNPVRNEAGHIYRIIGTSKNITERKQAERQLNKMSAAVEQSPAVVVITDPHGIIEYVNPMFTGQTGYSAEEAIGKNPRLLQSGLVPAALYKDLWKTILSEKVWHGELQNKKKNGDLFWESVVIAAILNKDGVITNFVAVKEDITDQKKMLNELIAAKEKAEENDRLKSAFLANISHEIRTPMNGILGFSELLKEPHLSGEEMAEYVDLIQKSGQRMLNLINDLIDISRIDAEETKLNITETPINELLHDLHAFFMPEAESKGLRLTCTTGLSDSRSIIKTDSQKLNQIFTNLIKNALKFTRKGGIDFGYTMNNGILVFYVIDSGMGIPVDMQDKIFGRFHQIDNTLTRGFEGAGLGLSITKAFVEMLGGKISVESAEGKGSKFFFTMAYMPAVLLKTQQNPVIYQESALTIQDLTILIAEDDEVSTVLLKKSLKGEDIHILFAENGQQAVDLVKHHPEINLVLMDIKMPLLNGYEATKQIKKLLPDLPVIAQTAFTSIEERDKAREAGFDDFITKPIKKSELLELIQKLLKRAGFKK